MTVLVVSITPQDTNELDALANQAWAGGADAVELRLDGGPLTPDEVNAWLARQTDRSVILTNRSVDEGGGCNAGADERAAQLVGAMGPHRATIDFELAAWNASARAREVLASSCPQRLILSTHDFMGFPQSVPDPVAAPREMPANRGCDRGVAREASPPVVRKLAYQSTSIADTLHALDQLHAGKQTQIAVAMGPSGLWTRVLARKLGAFATYCCLTRDKATADGQLTLREMIDDYRWGFINRSTEVYGVIGDPVAHSMSPALFNHWFGEARMNAVYLPLHVSGGAEDLSCLLTACRERPWLDVRGFSVTVPHKTAALDWVAGEKRPCGRMGETAGGADHLSRSIGACNTLVCGSDCVRAYNTDCYGAVDSLAQALGGGRASLSGATVDVLGSGGAARAVISGLREVGCRMFVYGRSPSKTQSLADAFGATARSWQDRTTRSGEILINCTSVGMWPRADESPMPADALKGCRLVFDLVYNPRETLLLRHAAECGAATLGGLDMFMRQAAAQFELWTGRTPNLRSGTDVVSAALDRRKPIDS